ncbi:hypothetical protein INT48_009161 [Thamnidium elegans]|uniref:Uncharacterized protein n=1 Tax=Thamnidium elegans TaxID=101142 RepID=A0A8H7VV77_9FUNG|nr:hypothetical protein INT48_009161 [Thamnidium elegans]
MEKEYEPSPIIPIGDKTFFCVEYPGYVKRVKRALETLGGEKALTEALNTNSTVDLKYRPGDPFSHAIKGQILPTSKLLVKVTRRVKKNKEAETKWETKVEGVVTNTLRFRNLADFQYIVPKEDKVYQLKEALTKGNVQHIIDYRVDTDDNLENLRNIPPPIFTITEGVLSYGYRQNAPVLRVRVKQPDGSFKIKLLNRSRSVDNAITVVRYHEENMPTKSWHNLSKLTDKKEMAIAKVLEELFEARPIWSRSAIVARLPYEKNVAIRQGLARYAYTFTNGPWQNCWVKYGIDPRKDPKYRIYQSIDIRKHFSVKDRLTSSIYKKPIEDSKDTVRSKTKYIFDGVTVLGISSFQLCDITDPDIVRLIENPKYIKSKPNKESGYYYKCVFKRIRYALRTKYESLAETGTAQHIEDIEEGLLEEIEKVKEESKKNGDAMKEIENSESSKRLKDVVDDYMEELVKEKPSADDDFDIEIDTLDDYDEVLDAFEDANMEEIENTQEIKQIEEDTIMNDP